MNLDEYPLTGRMNGDGQPVDLDAYCAQDGYAALEMALRTTTPTEITATVKKANLRGRGGGGFPTGTKWGFVPMEEGTLTPKYIVANGDEMEPGTFKDRLLMENDPHLLVEGMILSGYAIQASVGFIFIRHAYIEARRRLADAIAEAKARGLLGKNILNSGFDFELHIHESAGRYICGEETALLNALQGERAIPRQKPPYPQASGLWGHPTVVNNVETICNVPAIVLRGAEWYQNLGRHEDAGTKLYMVSGKVNRPGVWERPMGTPAREIIEQCAEGLWDGLTLRAFIPGGASTDFLGPDHLDTPLDYAAIEAAGSRLGTGAIVILDDQTCPVGMVLSLERFFARESCGYCTPCREGLPWTVRLLEDIEAGQGRMENLDILARHTQWLGPGNTFCAHAPGAMEPLQSALTLFREEFERHIHSRGCPWRAAR